MQRQVRILVGVLFILALLSASVVRSAPLETIIYVDCDATGGNDGSSWKNAYVLLQDALGEEPGGLESHEIWVAEGVYYPARTDTDRTVTFELADRVRVYGGFAGGETSRSRRDWEANVTVLSGDLGRDDITDGNGVVTDVAGIVGDNAYHVVTAEGVGSSAVLDGFVVTAGKAEGLLHPRGGGMLMDQSSPMITNVTFSGNHAEHGGGMHTGASSPILTNVTFTTNGATYHGGGLVNLNSNLTLTNVSFTGNLADEGGGMCNYESSPTLTNVVFSGNEAENGGGGVYNYDSSPMLTNVSFSGNEANEGGGMYNESQSSPTLVNSILWGNHPESIVNVDVSSADVDFSDVDGGYPGLGNIDVNPLFVDPVSSSLAPTTAGDYRLSEGSPAIDAGFDEGVTVATDLDGNPRIVDGDGDDLPHVDMGAYEFQMPLLTVVKQGEGLVTSAPGEIDCGSVCSDEFLPGTEVTLTADADPGWTFAGWSGDVDSTDNPLELTMEGDTTIAGAFVEQMKVYLPLVIRDT